MNCLQWNMYWDFGSGQVGDMGSHTMDLAWNAIDAGLPDLRRRQGRSVQSRSHACETGNAFRNSRQRLAAGHPGFLVSRRRHAGVADASMDLKKIDHGAMFEGSKGCLVADFNTRVLFPQGNQADLTYYKPRAKDALIPPMGNFQKQWINACKGNLKTSCDFDYASNMIEMMLLGLVAYRVGKKINYDGAAGRVTDCPEANELLRRTYLAGMDPQWLTTITNSSTQRFSIWKN